MLFQGQLVNLRAYTDEDVKPTAVHMSNPEILYNLDYSAPIPQSYEMHKQWNEENRKKMEYYKNFELAIETKDGKYIGSCGVNHMDKKNRVAQIGIYIGEAEYQSKGYGTEAMKLLLEFLFNEYNVNKVKLGVFSFNQRAVKSYEKCGYQVEAVMREQLFRFGQYHDVISMAILKEDYFRNK